MAKRATQIGVDPAALKAALQQVARLEYRLAIVDALIFRMEEHAEDDIGERPREQITDRKGMPVPDQAIDEMLEELHAQKKELETVLKPFT